jgi:acyl-CoA oxidase
MVISGLPYNISAMEGGATFEGENSVLWQQTARPMLKQLARFQDGVDINSQVQYLTDSNDLIDPCIASEKQFLDPNLQLVVYHDRAHRLVLKSHTAIQASSKTPVEVWNEHMMLLISALRTHIEYFVMNSSSTRSRPCPIALRRPSAQFSAV